MDLNINDSLPTCEKCGGTGQLEFPHNISGVTFGPRPVYRTPDPCDACHGRGVIPTESGTALIEFIQRARRAHLIE